MMTKGFWLGALAAAALVTAAAGQAEAAGKCEASKLKAAGKEIFGKMGCHSKALAKALPVDPNCLLKAHNKGSTAYGKADGTAPCPGNPMAIHDEVDDCVDLLVPNVPDGANNKCEGSALKAQGKGASALHGCESKEVTKPGGLAACDTKNQGKLSAALTKAGACHTGFADINADIHTCTSAVKSTILPSCDCCGNTRFAFLTAAADGSDCGTTLDDTGNQVIPLECGGLYFGGGLDGVPLPALIPDYGNSYTKITACNSGTGELTLGHMTSAETGSNRDCTAAGCLYGAPLPIPNATATSTSTCVINVVATNATGTANCNDGSVASLNLPLSSGLYLTGDELPGIPGIQPCPICDTGTNTCQGGPNNGVACVPGTLQTGGPYPTSHDCPPDGADFIGALPIGYNLTTGTQSDTAITTGGLTGQSYVFCGYCSTNAGVFLSPAQACTADAQCPGSHPRCRQRNDGAFGTDLALLNTVKTISATGTPAGVCMDDGAPHDAKLVSVFCIPPSFNSIVDPSADLPGPGAAALPGEATVLP
jgi:hypothetical protein